MDISHIEHIGIAVKSLDEAIPFWEKQLGLKCYAIEEVKEQKVRTAFFKIGQSKIELLESTDPEGPIGKFIEKKGEGIQHVAILTDDLVKTWDQLKKIGMRFMTAPPDTYYEMLEGRLPNHGEPVDQLQSRGILLDGSSNPDDKRLLLQIFSETLMGPVFFEFIQRKGDDGFGEGNFKALFESIERDQVRRGVLATE